MNTPKTLILGTALWGWTINQQSAIELLDNFTQAGFQWVDTAKNYPINAIASDFGKSPLFLSQFLTSYSSAAPPLKIIYKIGSINNLGQPDTLLDRDAIFQDVEHAQKLFGTALKMISIHWDNCSDPKVITKTIKALADIKQSYGYTIGLSGIKHADLYAKIIQTECPDLINQGWIQIKENLLTHAAREHYLQSFSPYDLKPQFAAYSINMGGVKTSSSVQKSTSSASLRHINIPDLAKNLEKKLKNNPFFSYPLSLPEFSLLFAKQNPSLSAIIIGPSTAKQLKNSVDFWEDIKNLNMPSYDHLKDFIPHE